jgi:hypothetical protein
MKVILNFFLMLMLAALAVVVNAWGYQVVWNDVVVNIWQLFSEQDILNTMEISYGVFLVIAIAIPIIRHNNVENSTDDVEEAYKLVFSKLSVKILQILFTILVVSIVFG